MPRISTIIPIYNVEAYLEETIQSIVSQDIGFKENCEILLIDDASPDESYKICEKYQKLYPDNIHYVKQDNAGVSAARNRGLSLATGEYVHFLDSDDVISKNAYSMALPFLDDNKSKIDLAAFRVEFFDGQLGEHPLNYKFLNGTRIINLLEEPSAVIVHVSSCVMRKSKIIGEFDSSIKISEDMKFLAEQVTNNMAYGVVVGPTYYYRKRRGADSAIDTAKQNLSYYTVTPQKVYQYLFDTLKKDFDGHPNIYAQYAAAYDIQWRLRQRKQDILSEQQEIDYIETIKNIIRQIDDEIFLAQKNLTVAQLDYIFSTKYKGSEYPDSVTSVLIERVEAAKPAVFIEFIHDIGNDRIQIEGRVPNASRFHDVRLFDSTGNEYELNFTDYVYRRVEFLAELVSPGYVFSVEISLENIHSLYFKNFDKSLDLVTRRQSKIPNARYGYRLIADRIVKNRISNLEIVAYKKYKYVLAEFIWLIRILASLQLMESLKRLRMMVRSTRRRSIYLSDVLEILTTPLRRLSFNMVTIFYRLSYRLLHSSKPIWIISDRPFAAGDNGEAFYGYIYKLNDKKHKSYFAIHKSSSDYKRLTKEYTSVIDSNSLKYKLLFLNSSKVISSQADDVVMNPFGLRVEQLYDLYTFDFVFLQHGIIRNDMSIWLNRYNKNISLFITSAKNEKDSILSYDYAYQDSNVVLSGLPRFDLLKNNPQQKIIIMPTWRRNLAIEAVDGTGLRPYNPSFKDSEYFNFYNSLINDKKLLAALSEYGYIAEFYLHPLLSEQSIDFEAVDPIKVMKAPYDYRKAFEKGSLLVTDYSSVFFDFAYLRKPVIYTQFDTETYYEGQMYTKGYMDDERDGFGPVIKTLPSTVDSIIEMIKSGCKMPEVYKDRVNGYYAWQDKNNCKRVYSAILEIESNERIH